MEQQGHTRSQSLRQGNKNYTQRPRSDVASETLSQRESSDAYDDDEYDDIWPSRMPTSARRYQSDVRTEGDYSRPGRSSPIADVQATPRPAYRASNPGRRTSSIPARRTATQTELPAAPPRRRTVEMEAIPQRRRTVEINAVTPPRTAALKSTQRRTHWLVYAGLAMLGMLIVWVLLTSFLSWWHVKMDDLHYGRPRTAQYDVVISPGDTQANRSHFIVMNLNRHIEIIDCPASDCSKAKVLTGPVLVGQGQDLAVVTLTFKDVNGDGKLDIVVNVQDSHFIFINDNGTFRPARQSDTIHL